MEVRESRESPARLDAQYDSTARRDLPVSQIGNKVLQSSGISALPGSRDKVHGSLPCGWYVRQDVVRCVTPGGRYN